MGTSHRKLQLSSAYQSLALVALVLVIKCHQLLSHDRFRLHGRGDPRDVGPDRDGIIAYGAHRRHRGHRGRGAAVRQGIPQSHRTGDGVVVATWPKRGVKDGEIHCKWEMFMGKGRKTWENHL